ncbi:hypothetical protein [Photobacterium minamisatsumaniensis]|uniref:hypothetical protein n=1 Tax=Photobacterium minamisatsumaniensis TaxID=2910233 RepID=UPI003D0CC4CB
MKMKLSALLVFSALTSNMANAYSLPGYFSGNDDDLDSSLSPFLYSEPVKNVKGARNSLSQQTSVQSVKTVIQPDEAIFIQGLTMETRWDGYSGDGYLKPATRNDDVVRWEVRSQSDLDHNIQFRYATKNDRSSILLVNGVEHQVSFPNTENYGQWTDTAPIEVILNEGSNIIELRSLDGYIPHLDNMTLTHNLVEQEGDWLLGESSEMLKSYLHTSTVEVNQFELFWESVSRKDTVIERFDPNQENTSNDEKKEVEGQTIDKMAVSLNGDMLTIVNKQPRVFEELAFKIENIDGSVLVSYLGEKIEAHTKTEFSLSGIKVNPNQIRSIEFIDPSPLVDFDLSYWGTHYDEGERTCQKNCGNRTPEQLRLNYEAQMSFMKHLYNQSDVLERKYQYFLSQCNTSNSCPNWDSYNEGLNLFSERLKRVATKEITTSMILLELSSAGGMANGRDLLIKENALRDNGTWLSNVFSHELFHNMGYSHSSGMAYGWSDKYASVMSDYYKERFSDVPYEDVVYESKPGVFQTAKHTQRLELQPEKYGSFLAVATSEDEQGVSIKLYAKQANNLKMSTLLLQDEGITNYHDVNNKAPEQGNQYTLSSTSDKPIVVSRTSNTMKNNALLILKAEDESRIAAVSVPSSYAEPFHTSEDGTRFYYANDQLNVSSPSRGQLHNICKLYGDFATDEEYQMLFDEYGRLDVYLDQNVNEFWSAMTDERRDSDNYNINRFYNDRISLSWEFGYIKGYGAVCSEKAKG